MRPIGTDESPGGRSGGFADRQMGVALPVPDPTQMSRRAKRLAVVIPLKERPGPVHWVVDSTGLKIHGEGECKVRQQGGQASAGPGARCI
jgi:hypothetical protein